MNLSGIKEIISRIRFFIDRIKYKKGKHFNITIVILLILLVTAFAAIYVNLQVEIKRKENILRSYYSEVHSVNNGPGKASGENNEINPSSNSINTDPFINNGEDIGKTDNTFSLNRTDNIKAYVCGEVGKPGVYEVKEGSRVIDLLELAGGPGENACLEIINLARVITDGERIYIPSKEEIGDGGFLFYTDGDLIGYNSSGVKTININTANLKELELLPGVGPVIAKNIIEYRKKHGLFKRKEELKNVTGIGEKKYEEINQFISI